MCQSRTDHRGDLEKALRRLSSAPLGNGLNTAWDSSIPRTAVGVHKGMNVCVEMNILEVRRTESGQSVSRATARRGPSGESKDAISHHKGSERSGWKLMVNMTKHPLHYSRVLVMPLLSLDLWPLETVNMIIAYSSGLLQKVVR